MENVFTIRQRANEKKRRILAIVIALSLVVTAVVFWWLRLIGITHTANTTCGKEEHAHTEDCIIKTLTCGLEELDPENSEMTDGFSDIAQTHIHTDSCYTITYNCDGNGNEIEEHEHNINCYADVNADIETAEDWTRDLPELSGIWADDIVAVARSQIGVRESIDNYIVDDGGEVKGITRYGQWYGNPYADWNAMFACFCLNYSGFNSDNIPFNAGCHSWQLQLVQAGLWREVTYSFTPIAGEILFVDSDGDGNADRVGIVTEILDDTVYVIEGDYENAVGLCEYSLVDGGLIGYLIPVEALSFDDEWELMTIDEKTAYLVSAIERLPSVEEVQDALDELEEADDFDGMETYSNELYAEIQQVLTYYYKLDEEYRESVTNREILLSYAESFDISPSAVTPQQKPARDNTDKLEVINGIDTRSFIELNLYNYGSNINDLFVADKAHYPGFQQNGGAITVASFGRYNFGFGDNITTDLMAGLYNVTNSGALINSTYPKGYYPTINLPASMRDNASVQNLCDHIQIMDWTLGEDGYPVSHEGNVSLKYLFSEEPVDGVQYATKMNHQSITGLFKYDPTTGIYSYNSRENHAQFDAETDSFTLYKQRITPNFIIYPFGNFLPFNDIVHDSIDSKTINKSYFQTIANSAKLKSQTLDAQYSGIPMDTGNANENRRTPYAYLAAVLDSFMTWAEKSAPTGLGKGANWTAMDVVRKYYDKNTDIPTGDSLPNDYLYDIYNLDYDVPTDFFFGMEMKMDFVQSRGGINSKGQRTLLRFTGDDDVLFYIDGVLFLDLSGIHRHVGGEIDFKKGEVRYYHLEHLRGDVDVDNPEKAVLIESFDTILRRAGKIVAANSLINGTFADYSSHTLNWYYMERGSGSGVCRIEFNLEQVTPSGIYKVNQYGDAVAGASFAVYKSEKVNGVYTYLLPDNTRKLSSEITNVNKETGLITFNDNTTMSPSYLGHTESDGSMIFMKGDGETMSLNDMRGAFGEHFILREIKVPDGYRLVAAESWMTFSGNTLICENTLDSGTWAAPNAIIMATEDIYAAGTNEPIHYYTRTEGAGDIETVNGAMFAVAMRKCDNCGNAGLGEWHPITGSDFDGYNVSEQTGIQAAINAAKTYRDENTGAYTHQFDVGQMYMPELASPIQIGMIVTMNELPGEPETYYSNVLSQYLDSHPGCNPADATQYALENSRYSIVYYYTTASSLEDATPSNTVRVYSRSVESAAVTDFQVQWSAEVQVPNVVNALYFQKTDIAGNLIDNAVFGLYDAVKGPDELDDGYYKADLVGDVQYYVRLDTDNNSVNQDATVYNADFQPIATGTYTIGTSEPDLINGISAGLLTDVGPGIITVTAGGLTITLTPAVNADGKHLVGYTHDACDMVDAPGTGHFTYLLYDDNDLNKGRYFLKELYAPAGYLLSRENVKIVVRADAVFANAGTVEDHVIVGNGPGYLVKTLDNFATKEAIGNSLSWTYCLLRVADSLSFADFHFFQYESWNSFAEDDIPNDAVNYISTGNSRTPNGDPYNGTTAMVGYYEFAGIDHESGKTIRLFDYKRNDRSEFSGTDTAVDGIQGSLVLWTKFGWSDLSVYQDSVYGESASTLYPHSTYRNIGTRDIANLFSSSTVVRVMDDGMTRLQLVKEDGISPDIKLGGAEFILRMTGDSNNTWTETDYLYYDDVQGAFRLKMPSETLHDLAMTTDENGVITLNAPLAPGNYTLLEVKAPDGYKMLTYGVNITVSVDIDNHISFSAVRDDSGESLEIDATPEGNPDFFSIHVENYSDYELPATGGEGVFGYCIAGVMLMSFPVVCFCRQRKKKKRGGASVF